MLKEFQLQRGSVFASILCYQT